MTINQIKLFIIAIIVLPLFAFAAFNSTAVIGSPVDDDAATTFKTKCAMCHSPKAEKAFDPAKEDEVLIQTVLQGKKDARPPMPGYEAKGMTKEQAAALVAHMKSLRAPAN